MFDGVDMFTSRRKMFNECYYWCRSKTEENEDLDEDLGKTIFIDPYSKELSYEIDPSGTFEAIEINNYDRSSQIIGGSFMFDSSTVTLKTFDYIPELGVNDIVVYNDNVWRVVNISRRPMQRTKQFSVDVSYETYISLKG
jgi:hypothetical protein